MKNNVMYSTKKKDKKAALMTITVEKSKTRIQMPPPSIRFEDKRGKKLRKALKKELKAELKDFGF